MFEPTKLEQWHDSLPAHTKAWLKKQPLWHDADLFRFFVVGMLVGFLIGIVI
jgi:hypothetical protein